MTNRQVFFGKDGQVGRQMARPKQMGWQTYEKAAM